MIYKGNKITINELDLLLGELPEDEELLELKTNQDNYTKMLLNSNVFENNNQKYYKK